MTEQKPVEQKAAGKPIIQNPIQNSSVARKVYSGGIKGVPVEEGQDWRHLTAAQRAQAFNEHEQDWKKRFGQQQAQAKANMNWTRG